VEIFTVVASDRISAPDWLEPYEKAITFYREANFEAADDELRRCESLRPDDALVRLYRSRIQELRESPPDEKWSPAVQLDKK
jgi:hypothetical protein